MSLIGKMKVGAGPSDLMVDRADVPPLRGDVDIRDRQVVDLMGHRGMGIHAKRTLDLCQDHAEMRHGDDICVRMGLCDPVNGGVDPRAASFQLSPSGAAMSPGVVQ